MMRLMTTSPCVSAGSIKVPNYSKLDIDGTKRSLLTPTIGAYEN